MKKNLFAPISIKEYIKLQLKINPTEDQVALEKRLEAALSYALSGNKCNCGNNIWVVGAAQTGYSCFSCITGEATPDNDYEIDLHISHVYRTQQKI